MSAPGLGILGNALSEFCGVGHQLASVRVASLVITSSTESPRALAQIERNVRHSHPPPHALLLFVLHLVFSLTPPQSSQGKGATAGCGISAAAADTDVYPLDQTQI